MFWSIKHASLLCSKSAPTLSIATFSITTLSIMGLLATFRMNDTQNNGIECYYAACRYDECRNLLLLCWTLLCWVSLDLMSLCLVSWLHSKGKLQQKKSFITLLPDSARPEYLQSFFTWPSQTWCQFHKNFFFFITYLSSAACAINTLRSSIDDCHKWCLYYKHQKWV